jgi:hypothetical protein
MFSHSPDVRGSHGTFPFSALSSTSQHPPGWHPALQGRQELPLGEMEHKAAAVSSVFHTPSAFTLAFPAGGSNLKVLGHCPSVGCSNLGSRAARGSSPQELMQLEQRWQENNEEQNWVRGSLTLSGLSNLVLSWLLGNCKMGHQSMAWGRAGVYCHQQLWQG